MRGTLFVRRFPNLSAQRLKQLGIVLGMMLLVALPRLTDLSGYLIIDEADRWRWAEEFYRALIAGNLHGMLVGDGYPGIVPVWLETIWLLGESVRRSILEGHWFGEDGVYLLFHVWSRSTHLALQRLPIALFNTLLALLVGWYAGKAYGRRVGLVALALIALNPFLLADSRVNRAEAVITGLLTLSILFMVRYGQTRQHRWLMASGLMGGLGLLTKIQGLVVLPAVAVILFLVERKKEWSSWLLSLSRSLVFWALAAIVVWVVLWPATWVRPLDVVTLVFNYATRKAGSEGVNLFFMGQHFLDEDPGLLFYPVVAVLRTTPLTMLGLILALWAGARNLRSGTGFSQIFAPAPIVSLLIYIVLYGIVMSLGSHKQDRYLMPIFPVLDIVAAVGWVHLWDWLGCRWKNLRGSGWTSAALASLVALQLVSILPYHPYYFPYFNQLMGGGAVGARALRVGWGEGMDRVAGYLNAKPDAASLKVAARWYRYMLDFAGKTLPFDERGEWTQADYVVLYIQQTQRMLDPSPGIIRYFQGRQPEQVITLNGIEYAQIYPSPFTRSAQPLVSCIPGRAALFGYRWEDAESPGPLTLRRLRVIWENQGVAGQPFPLVAALTNGDVNPDWQTCSVAPGFEMAARTPGEVVESVCDVSQAGSRLPPGVFDVRIGVGNDDGSVDAFLFSQGWRSAVKEEDGSWRPADQWESLDQIARHQVPPHMTPVDVYYQGKIRLVAYDLSGTTMQPGQSLTITLYWQAMVPVEDEIVVFNHLFGLDGTVFGEADKAPAVPVSQWLPGQIIATTHHMQTDPTLPVPAVVTLDIGLYNADGERRALPMTDRSGQRVPPTITRLKFVPAVWPSEPPPVAANALFGDRLLLEGHSILPEAISPRENETLSLQLWWQTMAPVDTDYTVFIHLVDAAGKIVAQADGVPADGRYPTNAWEAGERIVDNRLIALPADLPGGQYHLIVGLYNPLDGSRLPLAGRDAEFASLCDIVVR